MIALTACGGEDYTAEQYNGTDSEIAAQPAETPQPTLPPSPSPAPRPVNIINTLLQPRYKQIAGRITAIHGLITDDGMIHEYVQWLHVYIEDESNSTLTRLVATPYTHVPFGNLFVGEVLTAFIHDDRAMLADQPPTYIASMLVVGLPDGMGIGIYYIGEEWETRVGLVGNEFQSQVSLYRRIPQAGEAVVGADGRLLAVTSDTIQAAAFPHLSPLRGGFAFTYAIPAYDCTAPIPITERILINETFSSYWQDGEWEMHLPIMHSFDDFTIHNLPVFVHHELLEMPVPPILYHDGTTVMVPFKPIARSFDWAWLMFHLYPTGPSFGVVGAGSGETAMMRPDTNIVSGTGFSRQLGTPTLMVEGILYVPLFGFFAGAPPFRPSDTFIYNGEIHVVGQGWSILQGWHSPWWFDRNQPPERQIAIDISALPIYVEGRRISAPPAILSEDGYDFKLPVIPVLEALGFTVTPKPCGQAASVTGGTFRTVTLLVVTHGIDVQEHFPDFQPWTRADLVNEVLYACFWQFFRWTMNVGGFAGYTRIELFNTGVAPW